MSELRYDLIHDEYILIAPERLHRPREIKEQIDSEEPKRCPFCPGNESLAPDEIYAIRQEGHWLTRVVPNLYKAVQIETPFDSHREGVNEVWGGFGAHEIVIDTPRHDARLATMTPAEIFLWLQTLRERVADLRRDRRLIQIECFKNHGAATGATQPHPHTQLLALPVMSKARKAAFVHAHRYWREHGRSLFDDIVDYERGSKERLLKDTEHFFAYCPFASAFPFETLILAKGAANLTDLEDGALQELAEMLREIFVALERELGSFAYNLLLMLPPVNRNFENAPFFDELGHCYRFYLRITPRLYKLAGFELMSGSAINPVTPELAARVLRGDHASGR